MNKGRHASQPITQSFKKGLLPISGRSPFYIIHFIFLFLKNHYAVCDGHLYVQVVAHHYQVGILANLDASLLG